MLARDYVPADGEEFWKVDIEYASSEERSGYATVSLWFIPAFSEADAVRQAQGLWVAAVASGEYRDWNGEISITGVQREGYEGQRPACGEAMGWDGYTVESLGEAGGGKTIYRLLGTGRGDGSGPTIVDEVEPYAGPRPVERGAADRGV